MAVTVSLQVITLKNVFYGPTALVSRGLSIVEISRSYSVTPSVGLFWTRDRPIAVTCTWQHTTPTDIHAPAWIRTRNPTKRAARDLGPRFPVQWYRHLRNVLLLIEAPKQCDRYLSTFNTFFRYPKLEIHYLEYYIMRDFVVSICSTVHALFLIRYHGFGI
jgi:hypothetical protein